jgi:catechol 2,3-dioxygenase-like lactoylglutathione lyase family enzyme
MISGGSATIFVSDMERSIRFFTETFGLALRFRSGDAWAEVDAGGGLVVSLHPAGPDAPRPGTRGSITIGFDVTRPLDRVVKELGNRGVLFRGPIHDEPGELVRFVYLADPDGNELYLSEIKPLPEPPSG